MPRRLFRALVPTLFLLSLLVCAGTACLWWRSYRGHGRVGYLAAGGRYTLQWLRGRLLISGPPPNGPDDETARKPAARLSNDELDIAPFAAQRRDTSWRYDALVMHRMGKGLPASEIAWRYGPLPANDPASAWPPLLQALEDPSKFAIAHEVLGNLWSSTHRAGGRVPPAPASATGLAAIAPAPTPAEVRGDEVTVYVGRLPVHYRLRDLGPAERHAFTGEVTRRGRLGVAQIDSSEAAMAAVRDFWHDQLDVVVWSAPLLPFAVLTAVPPLAWCASRVRGAIVRRRRTRRGLCPACGYDLRASQGKCSECGAPIPVSVVPQIATAAAVPRSV